MGDFPLNPSRCQEQTVPGTRCAGEGSRVLTRVVVVSVGGIQPENAAFNAAEMVSYRLI